jgi:multidrug efflux system outer membrane protein
MQLHAQALSTDLSLIKALGGGYRTEAVPAASTSSSTSSAGAADHERQ